MWSALKHGAAGGQRPREGAVRVCGQGVGRLYLPPKFAMNLKLLRNSVLSPPLPRRTTGRKSGARCPSASPCPESRLIPTRVGSHLFCPRGALLRPGGKTVGIPAGQPGVWHPARQCRPRGQGRSRASATSVWKRPGKMRFHVEMALKYSVIPVSIYF